MGKMESILGANDTRYARSLTPKVCAAVFKVWKGRCAYCRVGPAEEVDHIRPRALGGADDLRNYLAACSPCNRMKSARLLGRPLLMMLEEMAVEKADTLVAMLDRTKQRVDPRPALRQELRDLMCDEADGVDGSGALDQADVEGMGVLALREEIAAIRRQKRERQNALVRQDLIRDLVEARVNTGMCPTAARVLTARDESMGRLGTAREIRKEVSRVRPKRDRPDGLVDLAMSRDAIRELLPILRTALADPDRSQEDRRVEIDVDAAAAPELWRHLATMTKGPLLRTRNWGACLVRDACIYDGAKQGKFIVSSRMLAAAERCLELGVARFSFWDPFDLQRVPPALWCVPE